MNIIKSSLAISLTLALLSMNPYVVAKESSSQVAIEQDTTLTKLETSADVTITTEDIGKAREGEDFSATVAMACLYTNDSQGRADIMISGDANHTEEGNYFALYNSSLGKIPIELYINPSKGETAGGAVNGMAISSTGFSDTEATSSGCPNNQLTISMKISSQALAQAKAGTYSLHFNMVGKPFSG